MNNGWGFLVDEEKGGRLLTLDTSSSFENLKVMVCEDFGIDVHMVNIELSYLPSDLINSIYSPPVIITSDRKVRNFLTYVKNKASTQLCVNTQASNIAEEEGLTCSSYFIIKKYVPDHSCAASNRKGSVRTVSAKTMGTLIMHKHAIKAGFSVGIRPHTLTDDMYTTASWRSAYEESINPISVPEDAWKVPSHVEK
uniref:Uncharacterized protein n=1 Tax=Brassica oleracea var. oleracea TaxID=109376 RepID=A0A0D3CS30_BRAOL